MFHQEVTLKQISMKYAPIIFIILAVGIFFTYIQPQNEKLLELKKTEVQYTSAQKQANNLRTTREGLQDTFKKVNIQDQERLKLMLPDSVDNVRLLLDLTELARQQFGIELSTVNISSGGSGEEDSGKIIIDNANTGVGTVRVSFNFITTYEEYKEFLQALEKSLRLFDIKRLTVRTSEGPLNSYSVAFDTYWLR